MFELSVVRLKAMLERTSIAPAGSSSTVPSAPIETLLLVVRLSIVSDETGIRADSDPSKGFDAGPTSIGPATSAC